MDVRYDTIRFCRETIDGVGVHVQEADDARRSTLVLLRASPTGGTGHRTSEFLARERPLVIIRLAPQTPSAGHAQLSWPRMLWRFGHQWSQPDEH